MPYPAALEREDGSGRYRLDWRDGPRVAASPLMACISRIEERLVAMTWYEDTYTLVCNPAHPCLHADPVLEDLPPGESTSVRGALIFFEGSLEAFTESQAKKAFM